MLIWGRVGNVAIHLRQGYGGQDVKMLPVAVFNTNEAWKLGGATKASMEGFNGKVRWLIKQAFGFRDSKYFELFTFVVVPTKFNNSRLYCH